MVIQLTDEQQKYIEEMAKERGYNNPADYIMALVDEDDYIDDPEEAAIDLEEQFREAWHDAMTGQVIPADEALAELRTRREKQTHDEHEG
jgi:Arc/MetJ-type ribon-helix-helix transcriptional regulator